MWRLPVERAAISSALTSGMPPPSSVASVRAICDVENLWTLAPTNGSFSIQRSNCAPRPGCLIQV